MLLPPDPTPRLRHRGRGCFLPSLQSRCSRRLRRARVTHRGGPAMATNASEPLLCPLLEDLRAQAAHGHNSSVRSLDYAAVALHALAALAGLAENALVLVLVGCRMRPTAGTAWLLHLALSDLLACLLLPFFTYFLAVGHSWTLGRAFCRLHSGAFFLHMFASAFLLGAISVERLVRAARPAWARRGTGAGATHALCAALWALALLHAAPYVALRDTVARRDGRVLCYYDALRLARPPPRDRDAACRARHLALALAKFLLAFALPLALLAGCHALVGRRLRRGRGRGRRSGRFARLVGAVVGAFALCWGPYHALSLLEARAHAHAALRPLAWRALPLATSLAFLNSVLNPLLYVCTCPDVRRRLRRELRRGPWGSRGRSLRASSVSSSSASAARPLPALRGCCGGGRGASQDPHQAVRPRDTEGGPRNTERPGRTTL